MGHQSYVLLCTETALSNHPAVIPKSSCDVHLLRSPWVNPCYVWGTSLDSGRTQSLPPNFDHLLLSSTVTFSAFFKSKRKTRLKMGGYYKQKYVTQRGSCLEMFSSGSLY